MTDDTPSSDNARSGTPRSDTPRGGAGGDIVDAVYEVALDPSRYDDLVKQWHRELWRAADTHPNEAANSPLAEHFERATTILERVHKEDWQADSKTRGLLSETPLLSETQPMPELTLNSEGRVIATNPGAIALLSAGVGQTLFELDLTIAACEQLEDVITQFAQQSLFVPNTGAAADVRVLRINRAGDDRPLVVLLTPVVHDGLMATNLRCAEIIWPDSLGPLLARAFDLTGAECDVVRALVAGQNAAGIAAARGTSRETVRTQIRELLAKTGTHSQLELIRMTIGFSMMAQQAEARAGGIAIPGTLSDTAPAATNSASTAVCITAPAQTLIELGSGRCMEVLSYGNPNAQPVLVFHDEVIGDAFILPLLKARPELRFVVPVRHGYGRTDLLADSAVEARVTQGLADLAYALGKLDKTLTSNAKPLLAMPLLAHGNGIYFASRFAAAHPKRCGNIVTIAASLPRSADDQPDSTRYASFVSSMAHLAPSMLRFAAQAGFAMYARTGAKRFLQTVYGSIPNDQAIIDTEEHMADLQQGGRLTLAQGYRGFLHDEQAIAHDWTALITQLPLDIHILLGNAETQSRRERARRLEQISRNTDAASPHSNIRIIDAPDAGFFLAFSAPDLVLDALRQATDNH